MHKHIFIFRSAVLFFCACIIIVACKRTEQKCENNGVYNTSAGVCDCPTGYSGDQCEIEWRSQFIGLYNMTDDEQGLAITNYDMNIVRSTTEANSFYLKLLHNKYQAKCYAIANGSSFDIPVQTINGVVVSGNGFVNQNSVLHVTYYTKYINNGLQTTHLADGILK